MITQIDFSFTERLRLCHSLLELKSSSKFVADLIESNPIKSLVYNPTPTGTFPLSLPITPISILFCVCFLKSSVTPVNTIITL